MAPGLPWPPRRIVTGHDGEGRSVVVSAGSPPVVREAPGGDAAFAEIWSTSATPAPVAAVEPEPTERRPPRVSPDRNGTVVRVVEHRARSSSPMHRTETVDYGICLEGELYLVLDDSEIRLGPGDVVVQRGTDHRWENRSDGVARMAFVLVDGEFTPGLRASLGDVRPMDAP
jgi:quercetin dioxygenase-like cupin family protein